jgi:hypothetical protein
VSGTSIVIRMLGKTIRISLFVALVLGLMCVCNIVFAQQKKPRQKEPTPPSELSRLRDDYIKATKDYKASLERLLAIYLENVKKADEKLANAKKLSEEGLISRNQVEDDERLVKAAQEKVSDTRKQMASADSQIADVLVESEADAEMAKNLRMAKGALIRTTAFTRYNGTSSWSLNDAWKIERFFSDSFHRQLPIAVFGQGAVHDRWHLDHRNAMDIQLHPDGPEGQALLNFLQKNGIPYSAFRSAIPGTATGPHIHIGRPSHRY